MNHYFTSSRMGKVKFPSFREEGLEGWLCRSQQFFDFGCNTRECQYQDCRHWHRREGRVVALDVHEGQGWCGNHFELGCICSCIMCKIPLKRLWGSLRQPKSLVQTFVLQEYIDVLDGQINKVEVSNELVVSFLLVGLKEEIKHLAWMHKPQILHETYELVRLLEASYRLLMSNTRFPVQESQFPQTSSTKTDFWTYPQFRSLKSEEPAPTPSWCSTIVLHEHIFEQDCKDLNLSRGLRGEEQMPVLLLWWKICFWPQVLKEASFHDPSRGHWGQETFRQRRKFKHRDWLL